MGNDTVSKEERIERVEKAIQNVLIVFHSFNESDRRALSQRVNDLIKMLINLKRQVDK